MRIYHISGKNNPANGPSQQEDYLFGDRQFSLAHAISNKLVENYAMSLTSHDLHFQSPSQNLL